MTVHLKDEINKITILILKKKLI